MHERPLRAFAAIRFLWLTVRDADIVAVGLFDQNVGFRSISHKRLISPVQKTYAIWQDFYSSERTAASLKSVFLLGDLKARD